MAQISLLRTAAGSAPAVSQFDYFRRMGVRIVAADSNPLSVGLFAADRGYRVSQANATNYINELIEICEREQVTAFLPALDEELIPVELARERFCSVGTLLILSPHHSLQLCTDKWQLYQFLSARGIPMVPSRTGRDVLSSIIDVEFPVVVKPRHGRGSTNIFVARTQRELTFFVEYVGDAIVQPFINGVEFTVDVLLYWDSKPVVIAPRRRIAADSGISYKGQITSNQAIVDAVSRILSVLELVGPVNIQCFLDREGQISFTEINARLAGSSILTAAAGVPLYEGIVDMIAGRSPRICLEAAEDLVMLRYWSELYVPREKACSFGWKP